MHDPLLICTPVLLGSMALGLFHILRGTGPADSLLAVLLLGTTGIAMIMIFAAGSRLAGALDMALAATLLAAVVGVAFLLYGGNDSSSAEKDPEEFP